MSRVALIGLLLTVVIGVALWWTQPWTESRDVPPGSYVCETGDTLKIAVQDPSLLTVTASNGRTDTLKRTEASSGTLFVNPSGAGVLWVKNNSLLYQRNDRVRSYGCQRRGHTVPTNSLHTLDPWFRAPTGLHEYGYTLQFPRNVDVDRPRPHLTRFLFAGPTNDPPALTDGFLVNIRLVDTAADTSVQQFVRREIRQSERAGGEVLSPVRDTTLQTRDGLYWRQESVLGNTVDHHVVALDSETAALITSSAVGAKTNLYERTIDAMLSTLRFRKRTDVPSVATTSVPMAMLRDPEGTPEEGCDDVVFVRRPVARTSNVLKTALDTLFSIDRDSVAGARHFLGRTNETLHVERAVVRSDTAHVFLRGKLTGLRGVCDHPRARIQIEETARRVAGVSHVNLYLNGERTTLQPSGRGSVRNDRHSPSLASSQRRSAVSRSTASTESPFSSRRCSTC